MNKFDLIQLLGNATCNSASDFLSSQHACTQTEAWNFGLILVVAALTAVTMNLIRSRRQTRRAENYFW